MPAPLDLVPFASWHLAAMDLRPWDERAFAGYDLAEVGRLMVGTGSVTILADTWPAVVFWFDEQSPGVAQCSMACDMRAERYKVALHRMARGIIDRTFANPGCRRLECNVVAGNDQGARWIKSMGFELEGTRRAWFPDGADAWLFGKVKK